MMITRKAVKRRSAMVFEHTAVQGHVDHLAELVKE